MTLASPSNLAGVAAGTKGEFDWVGASNFSSGFKVQASIRELLFAVGVSFYKSFHGDFTKVLSQISSDLKMIQESPSKTCLLCSCNAGQGGSHLKTNCHKEGPTRQTLNHPTAIQLMFGDLWE